MFPPIHPAARAAPRLSFLVWHDIIATERERLVWFDTTLSQFRAQCDRLARAGARPVSMETAMRRLIFGAPVPLGAVVLCFDDNTDGIFSHAFPELSRRRWPFVVSAHTDFVGVKTSKGHNDWTKLRRMAGGGATIVSQTASHPPDLRSLSQSALMDEMTRSRGAMARGLGRIPSYLTYPSGKWDERVARAAMSAGYELALTEDFGYAELSPHRFGIRRFSTHRRFSEAIAAVEKSSGK